MTYFIADIPIASETPIGSQILRYKQSLHQWVLEEWIGDYEVELIGKPANGSKLVFDSTKSMWVARI